MEILKFIFHNIWTFLGFLILFGGFIRGVIIIIRGYPPVECKDADLVAAYKLGRIDKRNDYHLSDEQILSEVKTILKHGSKTPNIK